MSRHACRRQRPYYHDEPYDPLPRPRSASALPTTAKQEARGWWVGGEWVETPLPKASKYEQRTHPSPIVIDDGVDSDCPEVPPPAPCTSNAGRSEPAFNFNDGKQAVPWATSALHSRRCEPRSFADTADDELLSYLAGRLISRGFLVEIDQFFRSHPEITDCSEGCETIMQLNSSSPLRAYRYFLRGYTRPARYIDGVVKSKYFRLPANYPYRPLRTKVDPELVDFFEGFEYRWDIIDRIDQAVHGGIQELARGRPLSSGYRRLICYAVWGNPSDAYKWYEYQLQEEYLPHRYLPEHVVLGHLPKLAGEADAQPSSVNTSRRHMQVRYRMARANDEGINVLDVLMKEFKAALVRKGFRRIDIDNMYGRARDQLENERRDPTGVDIVDLIMDEIPAQRPVRRIHANNGQYTRPVPNQFRFSATSSRPARRRRVHKTKVNNLSSALRTQAAELRLAKTNLERAYAQERHVQNLSSRCIGITYNFAEVTAARARAERRYVNCLVRYLRNTNQMSGVEATQMQGNFTRRKMQQAGMSNSAYLLGMYPFELK